MGVELKTCTWLPVQVKGVMRPNAEKPASIQQQILLRDYYVQNTVVSARDTAKKTGKVLTFRVLKF